MTTTPVNVHTVAVHCDNTTAIPSPMHFNLPPLTDVVALLEPDFVNVLDMSAPPQEYEMNVPKAVQHNNRKTVTSPVPFNVHRSTDAAANAVACLYQTLSTWLTWLHLHMRCKSAV